MKTGEFRWKERPREHFETQRVWKIWNGRHPGAVAGRVNNGYREIGIKNIRYLAHRLAWLYVHGEWPQHQIDHIDGDKLNNLIANLRLATNSQNGANRGAPADNTSGYKGVSRAKQRWRAVISVKGRYRHLGTFGTAEEAYAAYCKAARELHGEFARVE